MPVPSVSMRTVPATPLPAPKAISAIPAASASLSRVTSSPVALASSPRASRPIQLESTLAAVRVTPSITTPGKVAPTGPDQPNDLVSRATTPATASGVAGRGVSIFCRSASSLPAATSTGAALIPVPPMSTPSACMKAPLLFTFLLPGLASQAPAGLGQGADRSLGAVHAHPRHRGPAQRPQGQLGRVTDHRDHRRAVPDRHPQAPRRVRPVTVGALALTAPPACVGQVIPGELHAHRQLAQDQ